MQQNLIKNVLTTDSTTRVSINKKTFLQKLNTLCMTQHNLTHQRPLRRFSCFLRRFQSRLMRWLATWFNIVGKQNGVGGNESCPPIKSHRRWRDGSREPTFFRGFFSVMSRLPVRPSTASNFSRRMRVGWTREH